MHDFAHLNQILVLLFFSVITVSVFRKINLPAVLGYLLVGMIAGEHSLGLIPQSEAVEQIAEIGVVFLLFTIGLEVSIPKLLAMKNIVFGIGLAQVLVSTLSSMLLGMALGHSWQVAFAVGGALALSSTAIVVKQLTEQHELHSRHGHISLGVLLFQDLAVVPFLVLIPIFAQPDDSGLLIPISIALGKAIIAFAVIYLVGQYLLRPLMRMVSSTYSHELFTLFILFLSLIAAWLTYELGLSLAMGAFLAGIMLAETEYQHQVQTEIRPFKDVLMGLFFISVGTQFDWRILLTDPIDVLLLTLILVVGKGITVALITRVFGFETGVAMRSGISLGQGSEFGFAILGVALGTGLLQLEYSQPIIAAIVISMTLSPMLIRKNGELTRRFCQSYQENRQAHEEQIEKAAHELEQHVIICGFGRTGQNLSVFLKQAEIPFIALELDPYLIQENWDAGEPVYYGDSSHPEVLEHAGIQQARALVITFHDAHISEHITRTARRLHKQIPIIVRSRDDLHLEDLLDQGASEIVPDTVESSMMLAWHTLTRLGLEKKRIDRMLESARENQYARVRAFFHSQDDFEHPENQHHLHSIEIIETSPSVGKSINSFEFLQDTRVLALVRQGERTDKPDPDSTLLADDVLIVEGSSQAIHAAELELCHGPGH